MADVRGADASGGALMDRYGPRRLVAAVIEAASARGLCPVFAGEDGDRALAGARQVLDALHLPADEPQTVDVGGPASRRNVTEWASPC